MNKLIPKKGDFRMRAHINPFNRAFFPFPPHPSYVDWRLHFPIMFNLNSDGRIYCNTDAYPIKYSQRQPQNFMRKIDFIDIGSGYGSLLFGLAAIFPDKFIFGLEIRDKLVNFTAQKIRAYQTLFPSKYDHISVVRANSMKHLCNYFYRQSLEKIFICFPDPHFKQKNYKRRIINTGFLSQYAFLLKPGGKLYCVTDVKDLHSWHLFHLNSHTQFQEIKDASDPCIDLILNTDEGKKVERNGGNKYWAIFQKKKSQ